MKKAGQRNQYSDNNHSQHAQALLEFALVVSALVLILFGIVEFGRALYIYAGITNAASEGSHFGISTPADSTAIKNTVVSRAIGIGLSTANVTVTCSPCTSGNLMTVSINYTFQPIAPVIPTFPMFASSSLYIE